MPKGSTELSNARCEEIVNACEELCKTKSFHDITIKDIGDATSFSRTSVYNYFHTKEEIFLSLMKREYGLWTKDLREALEQSDFMTRMDFAEMLARSLEKRSLLLKLMSMNHYDIESNSRPEHLANFMKSYSEAVDTISACLEKYFPDMSQFDRQDFVYTFFPFMYGIYPYTRKDEKQTLAMNEAGVTIKTLSVYDITFNCVERLLRC